LAHKTSGCDIESAARGERAAQDVGGGRAPEGAMQALMICRTGSTKEAAKETPATMTFLAPLFANYSM
jgi:hypothetical protein